MMRVLLNLFLIAAIVTCPLRCLAGICTSSDSCCTQPQACSLCDLTQKDATQECRAEDGSDSHSTLPLKSGDSGGCQCICGGALVGSSDSLLTEQLQSTGIWKLVADALATLPSDSCELSAYPPDCPQADSGQSRCILYRALLL